MKKKNIKKVIALILGMSLTASALVGCGQKEEQKSSSEATESVANTESTAEEESSVKESADGDAGEENAVKWSGKISVAPYMFGPVENDKITPLIEEKLKEYGYDVTLENVYLENSQYMELLNLRLASGDAPDIFYAAGPDAYAEYCKQGLIASWDEAFSGSMRLTWPRLWMPGNRTEQMPLFPVSSGKCRNMKEKWRRYPCTAEIQVL